MYMSAITHIDWNTMFLPKSGVIIHANLFLDEQVTSVEPRCRTKKSVLYVTLTTSPKIRYGGKAITASWRISAALMQRTRSHWKLSGPHVSCSLHVRMYDPSLISKPALHWIVIDLLYVKRYSLETKNPLATAGGGHWTKVHEGSGCQNVNVWHVAVVADALYPELQVNIMISPGLYGICSFWKAPLGQLWRKTLLN